jgi:hypothetical protein
VIGELLRLIPSKSNSSPSGDSRRSTSESDEQCNESRGEVHDSPVYGERSGREEKRRGPRKEKRARELTSRKALDDQNAETAESISKLNDLKSKLGEYESQCLEHTTAIASAKGRCDEFTRGDVGRLQRMSPFFLLTFFPSPVLSFIPPLLVCFPHGMT